MRPYAMLSGGWQRLGLDENADERAIRRAYARELKKIDPGHDPEAFQALREAYEAALEWTQEKPASNSGGTARAAAPASETPLQPEARPERSKAPDIGVPPDDAEQLSESFCADFLQDFRAHADVRVTEAADIWGARLASLLAGEAIQSLQARARIEQRLADTLLAGWQRGNDVLFGVCVIAFGWDLQRNLDHLGRSGAIISNAIAEMTVIDSLNPVTAKPVLRLVRDLRTRGAVYTPAQRELVENAAALQLLAERLPNWARLVTDAAALDRWLLLLDGLYAQFEASRPQEPQRPPRLPPRVVHALVTVLRVLAMIAAVIIGAHLGEARLRAHPPPASAAPSPQPVWYESASAPAASAGWQIQFVASLSDQASLYALLPPPSQTPGETPLLPPRIVAVDENGPPPRVPPGLRMQTLETVNGKQRYYLHPATDEP